MVLREQRTNAPGEAERDAPPAPVEPKGYKWMSIGSDQAVRELSLVRRDDKRFHCELSSFQIQKDIDYLVFYISL